LTAKIESHLRWINIVAFLLMVAVNGLAGGTSIIGGKNTAEISDAYPTLVTPAGYVFSIWGIIYTLLGVFVFYQALASQREKEYHQKIGWLFALNCAANIIWLFLWQYVYLGFSVILMLILLGSLIMIYLRLDINRNYSPIREKLAVQLPFSVYLGWITIATIANISVALVASNWNGFGVSPEMWAMAIIIVALIIAVTVALTRKDVAYSLIIIWALVGISVNQGGVTVIASLTKISAIIVAVAVLMVLILNIRRKQAHK
jgi:benzodiazapine receptor